VCVPSHGNHRENDAGGFNLPSASKNIHNDDDDDLGTCLYYTSNNLCVVCVGIIFRNLGFFFHFAPKTFCYYRTNPKTPAINKINIFRYFALGLVII
jgi:hypothetical protein